jgi:hypothetical protein
MSKFESQELSLLEFNISENGVKIKYDVIEDNTKIEFNDTVPAHDDLIICLNELAKYMADIFYLPKTKVGKMKVTGIIVKEDGYILKGMIRVLTMERAPVISGKLTDDVMVQIYGAKDWKKKIDNLLGEIYQYYSGEKNGGTLKLFAEDE